MHPGQQALQASQPRRQNGKHSRARAHAAWRRALRRHASRHGRRPLRRRNTRAGFHCRCQHVKAAGARLFRGGAYKPRTSPYSFQGLGEAGLQIMAKVREEFGLGIITEAIDNESLDLVEEYADVIQIGARNMQNFSLLKRAGRSKKPVLLKRGMSATLDEFLMAGEYLMSEGNYNVILCERGVRTFSDFTRNTLDLSVVPAVQKRSHLADCGRSLARHRPAQQSTAALARRRRRGRRRAAGRGPPRSRPRAFGRTAIDPARGIRAAHSRSAPNRRGPRPHDQLKLSLETALQFSSRLPAHYFSDSCHP